MPTRLQNAKDGRTLYKKDIKLGFLSETGKLKTKRLLFAMTGLLTVADLFILVFIPSFHWSMHLKTSDAIKLALLGGHFMSFGASSAVYLTGKIKSVD